MLKETKKCDAFFACRNSLIQWLKLHLTNNRGEETRSTEVHTFSSSWSENEQGVEEETCNSRALCSDVLRGSDVGPWFPRSFSQGVPKLTRSSRPYIFAAVSPNRVTYKRKSRERNTFDETAIAFAPFVRWYRERSFLVRNYSAFVHYYVTGNFD